MGALLILAISILRRAHGSKFYGLIENNTLKRVVITSLMAICCVIYSGIYTLYGLLLIPLFWLWVAPGTHIGEGETKLAIEREVLAMPVIAFYAFYCHNIEMTILALLFPLLGMSYWLMRNQPGDRTMKAEFLMGAIMGGILSIVGA